MTVEAHSGEMKKTGKSGKTYLFGFGWALQYILEEKYGPNMKGLATTDSNATVVSEVLINSLRTREVNQIPDELSKRETFLLLDDFSEEDIKQLWKAGKRALGFMERILDLDKESVEALKQAALKNQSQPTGTDSSN